MSEFVDTQEWVPVHTLPGFECCIEYHVSRDGCIKSTKGGRERILKGRHYKKWLSKTSTSAEIRAKR